MNRNRAAASILILLVLAIVLGITGFLNQREFERETGHAHGYTTGYSIGYTDFLNGKTQNALKVAGGDRSLCAGHRQVEVFYYGI